MSGEVVTYQKLKELGQGSFGKAFLVKRSPDNSLCVIKQIEMLDLSPAERINTFREAKILEFMHHPNIIQFYEVYKTTHEKLCIVMEYAEGGDLYKKIKKAKGQLFPENQVLDWFCQICLALQHIHSKKILHRDIKSQNVFMTQDNQVKLGDFGIAKILTHTLEKAKTNVGTPYYLSPEIIQNQPYSFKTDIWSLGVLLYELCCQCYPFEGHSLVSLGLKITKGNFRKIPQTYSKELRLLISKLLTVDQNKRPDIVEVLGYPIMQERVRIITTMYNQNKIDNIIPNHNTDNDTNLTQNDQINSKKKNENDNSNQNANHISASPSQVTAENKNQKVNPLNMISDSSSPVSEIKQAVNKGGLNQQIYQNNNQQQDKGNGINKPKAQKSPVKQNAQKSPSSLSPLNHKKVIKNQQKPILNYYKFNKQDKEQAKIQNNNSYDVQIQKLKQDFFSNKSQPFSGYIQETSPSTQKDEQYTNKSNNNQLQIINDEKFQNQLYSFGDFVYQEDNFKNQLEFKQNTMNSDGFTNIELVLEEKLGKTKFQQLGILLRKEIQIISTTLNLPYNATKEFSDLLKLHPNLTQESEYVKSYIPFYTEIILKEYQTKE